MNRNCKNYTRIKCVCGWQGDFCCLLKLFIIYTLFLILPILGLQLNLTTSVSVVYSVTQKKYITFMALLLL